jgi:exopolysaccharide biosynthesis polyprenyl glycosylphosphotransferase
MTSGRQITLLLLLLDAFFLVLFFNIFGWLRGIAAFDNLILAPLEIPLFLLVLALYLIDGYKPRTDMISVGYTSEHCIALLLTMLITLLITFAFIPGGYQLQSSRIVIILGYLALTPITLGYRRYLFQLFTRDRSQRYFLFLGPPEACAHFDLECKQAGLMQHVLYSTFEKFSTAAPFESFDNLPKIGSALEYLEQYDGRLDGVVLRETNRELPADVAEKLMRLHFAGVPIYTLELFHQVFWRKIPLYRLNQTWMFQEGFQIAREPVFERLKRLSDIVLATIGLVLSLPLFLLVPVAILLEDRGPVFFRQTRVGKNRVPFQIIKFRSMRTHSDSGDRYTRTDDPRITRVGRLLRSARIDEFPQMWNVLRGDMSLIGPRAEWDKLVTDYEQQIACYNFRHLVKPGITGWAQVNFSYGDSLDDTIRKLEYDLYYIRYFSFILDASIVLKTIHIMLFGKGR